MPFSEGGELLFQFDVVAKKYLINKLFWGEVQEKVAERQEARRELITFVIDKTDILQNQPAIDLTAEDYERERDLLMQYDITNTKRFVRLSVIKLKD